MLTAEEFESVLQIKTDANRLFGAGESERALGGWTGVGSRRRHAGGTRRTDGSR